MSLTYSTARVFNITHLEDVRYTGPGSIDCISSKLHNYSTIRPGEDHNKCDNILDIRRRFVFLLPNLLLAHCQR